MNATKSQRAVMESIVTGLTNREIVCLWGNQPNGKTHIFYRLVDKFSVGLSGRPLAEIQPSQKEEYTIDILEGVEAPSRGDINSLKRMYCQILESYNVKVRKTLAYRQLFELLVELNDARIVPTLPMDATEILSKSGYSLYKILNQMRNGKDRIGPAALLSGNFTKRRMPPNFWYHIKEVQVGKVSVSEIEEFLSHLVPAYAKRFTPAAHKRLATCSSTLEMSRIARNAIENWKKHSRDSKIDTPIVQTVADTLLYSKHRIAA